MYQSSLAALKQKTGRTLKEWVKLVQKSGPATEKERHAWLKAEHGLGMNYAGWIAEHSVGKGDDGNPETYLKQEKSTAKNSKPIDGMARPLCRAWLCGAFCSGFFDYQGGHSDRNISIPLIHQQVDSLFLCSQKDVTCGSDHRSWWLF